MLNKSIIDIENMLSSGSWNVTFFKVNGTIRTMRCTRDWDIEKNSINWVAPSGKRSPYPTQVVVWDIDKNMFRSFRYFSVISMNKVDEDILSNTIFNKYTSVQIKSELQSNICKLRYSKVTGGIKDTLGTRDTSKIPEFKIDNSIVTKKSRVIPDYQIVYWDIEAKAWRSFRSSNLISISKVSTEVIDKINPNINKTENDVSLMLNSYVNEIQFIKRDGSLRHMVATSNIDIIKKNPKYYEYKDKIYPHIFLVWDMGKNDWRNVRFDSILTISKVESGLE